MKNTSNKVVKIDPRNLTMIRGQYAAIILRSASKCIVVDFYVNLNGDVNNSVSRDYPIEDLELFETCKHLFGSKKIVEFYDPDKNIGLELGYDIASSISVFFDIVDYGYDYEVDSLPKHVSMNIAESDPNYELLNGILHFIKVASIKERSDEDEHKLDNTQYKRSCGL